MISVNIKNEIKLYNETGKLSTHPYVYCTVTGEKTTMFGSNLANRIKKYGSLEKLLTEFKGRTARNTEKPPKPVRIKKVRTKKVIEKAEDQRYDIPVFKNEPPTVVNLLENKEVCQKLTRSECWRPDIYLNGSKTCDKCNLYKNCSSPLKRLSRSLVRV